MPAIQRFSMIFLCLFSFYLLTGCKQRLKDPQLSDPIYRDLGDSLKKASDELEKEKKKLEGLQIELKKTAPRTPQRTVALRDIQKSQEKILNLSQEVHFLKIRHERRGIEAKMSYEKAFAADQAWPDPKEAEMYLAQKRLRSAPRAWDKRVPKLHSRIGKSFGPDEPKKVLEKPSENAEEVESE